MFHMKLFLSLLIFSVLAYGGLKAAAVGLHGQTSAAAPSDAGVPVVVELFTSEGCSSCPPADALLAQLEESQPVRGAQVIAIEEHVDYWNHLGWADPFSSAEWTQRQQDYAGAFRRDGEYTPQMVVNGRNEFVGSRSDLAARAIEGERQSLRVAVQVALTQPNSDKDVSLAVSVGKLPQASNGDSAEVWLGVTESGLGSRVSGGENAGRNLRHASVLRSLRRIGTADTHAENASFRADAAVKLKPNWNRANLAVVVLVQEKKSRHILGAASLKLEGTGSSTAKSSGGS
jgi:hypothetical protein